MIRGPKKFQQLAFTGKGTFLSRADVARMRHGWMSSPDQGGDINKEL